MKVLLVAGARPNFMKIAPIYRRVKDYQNIDCKIVHTGQHYDHEMSQVFFDELGIPKPEYFLNAGSGSHANQTARIMIDFEVLCIEQKPDLVMVVGDVNSTLACSIVAKKLNIKVAHVEAGLRSFDRTMPEEINRIVTDVITDYYFVTEESGAKNLINEGKDQDSIYFVGNVMIDNLLFQYQKIQKQTFQTSNLKQKYERYAFLTLHRPSNVDDFDSFSEIASALNEISKDYAIIFAVHPRTRKKLDEFKIAFNENIHTLPPLKFNEALNLWKDASFVITDSGGLQEETTALNIPCLTLRNNTERPITIEQGTNRLAGTQKETIMKTYHEMLAHGSVQMRRPRYWDGNASKRIWDILINLDAGSKDYGEYGKDTAK